MGYQVFISHAAVDQSLAQRIFRDALTGKLRAYLYEHDARPGVSIRRKVLQEISNSDVVVALLTPAGAESGYVHQEIGAAFALDKHVIALVTPDAAKTSLGMLTGDEYLQINTDDPEATLKQLAIFLQRDKAQWDTAFWKIGAALLGGALLLRGSSEKEERDSPHA